MVLVRIPESPLEQTETLEAVHSKCFRCRSGEVDSDYASGGLKYSETVMKHLSVEASTPREVKQTFFPEVDQ